MVKILCLGNEFIEGDALAKEVGKLLSKKYKITNVKDSFQLMTLLNEIQTNQLIIIDIVKKLKEAQIIKVGDIRNDSILSAHDFDAGYVLKLIGKEFKIIGIPSSGNPKEIYKQVLELLKNN